jgi:hypothetical protein
MQASVATSPITPRTYSGNFTASFRPVNQLDSRNRTFRIKIRIEHIESTSPTTYLDDGESPQTVALQRLLHFNGNLRFGTLDTVFSAISNAPTAGALGTNLVNTSLNVTSGSIPGFPDYTFGNGSALAVQLLSNGDSVVTSGSQPVVVAGGGEIAADFGGVRVSYPGSTLTSSGPVAGSTSVNLPQGLSYTPNRASSAGRYLSQVAIPGSRSLGNQFRHSGDLTLTTPADAWVFDESRPLIYQVSSFLMEESGPLQFTAADSEWAHQAAYDQLDAQHFAGQHQTPQMRRRWSNEGHLRHSQVTSGSTVSFERAADGSIRTKSADLEMTAGSFITHHPAGTFVEWGGPGILKVRNGKITQDSVLTGANGLTVTFDGSCTEDDCGPPPGSAIDSVEISPVNLNLFFTSDGGLWANGDITPKSLQWGIRGDASFTHRTDAFSSASFHAPGQQLYAADNPLASAGPHQAVANVLSPGVLTLAGYDPASHASPVYAETTRYLDGEGIYPGATFVTTGTGNIGASRIADITGEYPYELLANVSKYYVRRSGVSGRHVANEGTFQQNLVLYDYNFEFTSYQLTFLSNRNDDSWVNGAVAVPLPSGFTQRFRGLKLGCTGALEAPEIDPDDAGAKPLTYWNGLFSPLSLRFAPQVAADCDDNRLLAIGLISGAANLSTPLAGSLAFMPNGNIGTLENEVVGVDGRLGLPALVRLDGPGNEKYPLIPVSKLYFNNAGSPGAPDNGYVNFAATCNVPFFEDLKVHVMTSAQAGAPATLYMAGGWTENQKTFFSNNKFDLTHRGFPHDMPIDMHVGTYQSPQAETPYVVRATQSLFGLVPLDYPLNWNSSARYFQSWPSAPTELLVLTVEHQVDYLSAQNAEITFGAQYDGLPQINLVSAVVEIVEGQTGAARALAEAAQSVFIGTTLGRGLDEIGNLVDNTMEGVLERAIQSIEEDVIDPLYVELDKSYQRAVAANTSYGDWINQSSLDLKEVFDEALGTPINAGADSLTGRLNQLSDASAGAASLIQRVSDAVDGGILAIDSVVGEIQTYRDAAGDIVVALELPPDATDINILSGILAKEGNPAEREIARKLVRELIRELAPPDLAAVLNLSFDSVNSEINGELNTLLEKADPALERITAVLMQARAYLELVKGQLANQGDILASFDQIITNAQTEINTMVSDVRLEAYGFINRIATSATYGPSTVLGSAGNLMDEFSRAEFKAFLRAQIRDRLLARDFIRQIQYVLRQKVSEIDISIRSAIDSAFGEVSRMCKDLIKQFLGPIDDTINGLTGDINSYVGAGSVDGYAHIQGDTLRRLRLDAVVQLKVPDEMKLQAYFEMSCYDSQTDTSAAGCLTSGVQAVEVKIGAVDVPLDWVSPDLRANLDVWFAMQTQPSTRPRGIGGALVMTGGKLDFQSLEVIRFSAGVAVGSDEAYLAASATVMVSGYEAAGGIFFGRSCSLEPLLMVDADAAALLGNPPFTGAYVYGETWIPISEVILGIPASCLFRISAGVGAGAFYFAEGPTFGGRMLLGVSGEALCAVSIRGDVSLTGVMSGGSLRFSGRGTLTGKAGYCPFCLKFRESAKITYQDGSWDVDF